MDADWTRDVSWRPLILGLLLALPFWIVFWVVVFLIRDAVA